MKDNMLCDNNHNELLNSIASMSAVERLVKRQVVIHGKVKYGQDMRFWESDFGDKVFTVEEVSNDAVTLSSPGYGDANNYGNGKIFVWKRYCDKIVAV